MGSLKQISSTFIDHVGFRVYSEEEIEKISSIHVTNEESFNTLGHYEEKGVYDLHMGPMTSRDNDTCKTCGMMFFNCSGHCGHIKLPLPLCNPFFYDILRELLERICPSCNRFQAPVKKAIQFCYECKFLFAGYDQLALKVPSLMSEILEDPKEAIEDLSNGAVEGEKGDEEDSCTFKETAILVSELQRIFEGAKRANDGFTLPTCNSQAVYTDIRKRFLYQTRGNSKLQCLYCKEKKLLKLKYQNARLLIKNSKINMKDEKEETIMTSYVSDSQPCLTAEQARTLLRKCFKEDGELIKSLYPLLSDVGVDQTKNKDAQPTDIFFMQNLLVVPPKYRPCNKVKDRLVENETSMLYKNVLKQSRCLKYLIGQKNGNEAKFLPDSISFLIAELGGTLDENIFNLWCQLQASVDNIFDSELSPLNRIASKGMRQIFEKKLGVIRRHLMGKRSDHSGRSVAAPDPWLAVDQVGVPIEFALKLYYPVPVTPWNVSHLRKLVQNGPLSYPGAVIVENEQGRRVTLKATDEKQRNAIAQSLLTPLESGVKRVNETKIVYRHLQNGDYVLMNRQPTLHKPSIQAHKARVMPRDKVLRLPYSSCKAYNADFDGDELNLHFPQNELSRSEAQYIITTKNQYVTPKDGSPLAGLIQDCIVASVKLTMRGKFFNSEDYLQLVFMALSHLPHKIRLVPPAILKPQKMWSGKQVITTLLLNLIPKEKAGPSFTFKTTVRDDMWQTQPIIWHGERPINFRKLFMTESEFIMREGELVCGIVDKCAIGSTSFGLIHVCYDLYGGSVASKILTSINRLCVFYLQWAGHTISLKEFVTSVYAAQKRRNDLKDLIQRTKSEVSFKLRIHEDDLEDHVETVHKSENEKEMSVIDASYTSTLGKTTSDIIRENEQSLYRSNLQNNMRMMIDTGAKGSRVNMNQMASLFGSVAIDGKRMPISITGKSLPSFKSYECDPRSGGYIPTRFVSGMEPRSYFFLCIVGRDSLQHTAVKTANSGYMQRCLIKHLEGISVKYDMTVRNSDGVVLQFEYGEDGLDVTKIPFLRSNDTIDSVLETPEGRLEVLPELEKHKKLIKKYKKECLAEKRTGGFLKFCETMEENSQVCSILQNPAKVEKAISSWRSLRSDEQENLHNSHLPRIMEKSGRSSEAEVMVSLWYQKSLEEKSKFQKLERLKKKSVPVSCKFFGSSEGQFGAVSEALDEFIENYYEEKYSKRRPQEQTLTKKQVKESLYTKALKCKVDPGEAVGALCAQAIGEPLTQMTLNTFHFAGRDELNVTLGVPRMIEILRTASEKINTPIMEVPFKEGISRSLAEKLKRKMTPVPLLKVISHVELTSSLERSPQLFRRAVVRFHLHPYSVYKKVYYVRPREVLHFMERCYYKKVLIKWIHAAINKVASYGSTPRSTNKEKDDDETTNEGRVTRGLEQDDSDDDEEENRGDDQAGVDGISGAGRQGTTRERDFSEDEDEEGMNSDDPDDVEEENRVTVKQELDIDDLFNSQETPHIEEEERKEEEEERGKKLKSNKKKLKNGLQTQYKNGASTLPSIAYLSRKNKVISDDAWIANYDFDEDYGLWCEVTLHLPVAEGRYDLASILKQTSENTLVHCMPNIKKAFVVEKNGRLWLRTEGVNIKEIYVDKDALNILDINHLYTNNIHLMAQKYGIEAAQRSVIKEIREVQKAYDIKVDFRHLSLLADYFTCEGVYKACSRFALDTCASTIQKMSYETCFSFLKKSLVQGMKDSMYSPSASVMVGQPVKLGTNCLDVLYKVS